MCGELFKTMAGVTIVHVPYRGSYMPDLLAGQVQVAFIQVALAIGPIRSGQLRALAVTSASRLETLPDVPAIDEVVPDYEGSGLFGIGAPKGTPVEIVDTLNNEINAVITDTNIKRRLVELGISPR